MILHVKRALRDMRENRFVSAVTVVTIMLSVLIVGAVALILVNAGDLMDAWKGGMRMVAYLESGAEAGGIERGMGAIPEISEVTFLSKETALSDLKEQLGRQGSLLAGLRENPLPDAFELRLAEAVRSWDAVEGVAKRVEALSGVTEVEYGQGWLGRFIRIYSLVKVGGAAMGAVFFMISVFIIANTIRLALYSRREEMEIMRLVGADDSFIRIPYYVEGIIQGCLGGLLGLLLLLGLYLLLVSRMGEGGYAAMITIRFLPLQAAGAIILSSALVGWLGCYLSLKQFLEI